MTVVSYFAHSSEYCNVISVAINGRNFFIRRATYKFKRKNLVHAVRSIGRQWSLKNYKDQNEPEMYLKFQVVPRSKHPVSLWNFNSGNYLFTTDTK